MKKVLQILAIAMLLPVYAIAQSSDWEFQTVIPPDTSIDSSHGAAFDAAGNLWTAPYYSSATDDGPRNFVYCYDTEGQPCEDVPYVHSVAAGDSTFYFAPITGLAADENGDIVISSHRYRNAAGDWVGEVSAYILKIDHTNGELLDYYEVTSGQAQHIAIDGEGYLFHSAVFPGHPIGILDPDMNELAVVTDNRSGFARNIVVNREGTRVYQPTDFSTEFVDGDDTTTVSGRVEVYEGDVFSGYALIDTMRFIGMDPGASAVCPQTGVVYFAASGTGGAPLTDPDRWDALTVYGFAPDDQGEYQVVDEVMWHFGDADPYNPVYRTMAISSDGFGMVLGAFDRGGLPGIQYFERDELLVIDTSVDEVLSEVPAGYDLGQNYPNPFNPATQINFEIGQSGMVTLKVYDVLGREVATLVNDNLQAGSHTASFDATSLSSGTYIYALEANGIRMSRKMMLVK